MVGWPKLGVDLRRLYPTIIGINCFKYDYEIDIWNRLTKCECAEVRKEKV